MDDQRPQHVYAVPAPILPSFSHFVDTLGQSPASITQEPRFTLSNPCTRPPASLSHFSFSATRCSKERCTSPRSVSIHAGENWQADFQPTSQSNFSHDDIFVPFTESKVRPPDPPRPMKRQRKDRNQPMNPHYTRDGNLRKRLAQACERCRSQKIKCQLRGPACVLCIKQGLECKFAPRGYQSRKSANEPLPRPHEGLKVNIDEPVSRSHSPRQSESSESTETGRNSVSASPPASIHSPQDRGVYRSMYGGRSPDKAPERAILRRTRQILVTEDLSIDIDPYLFDPSLTKHYVEQYFASTNQSPYYLLPKAPFRKWISVREKTYNEKLLLYAVLAAGTISSTHRDQRTHRTLFTLVAQDGLKNCTTWFELPVIHALLILSTVSAHAGELKRARDDSIAAMRCAYGLQLNEERVYSGAPVVAPYLTSIHVAECCRRTFWLAYIRSTVWGSFFEESSKSTKLQGSLKIPSSDAEYESGEVSEAPLLSLSSFSSQRVTSDTVDGRLASHMLLLIEAVAIIKDLQYHETEPATEHPESTTGTISATSIRDAIRLWRRRRDEIQLKHPSLKPLELQIMDSYLSLLTYRYLPRSTPQCLNQARHSAITLLSHLQHRAILQRATDPLVPCAIFLSFDTLTAYGQLTSVLDRRETNTNGCPTFMTLATQAVATISELAESSKLATTQLGEMKVRLAAIMAQSNTAEAWAKRGFFFRTPLCTSLRRGRDALYDLSPGQVAEALGLGSDASGEILEMRVPAPVGEKGGRKSVEVAELLG